MTLTSPCGRCLLKSPPWDALVYVTEYKAPLRQLIYKLKFNATPALAPALARLLLLRILDARGEGRIRRADIILSVPLHKRRAIMRGYNQSALIALPLARWLGCTYLVSAITRQRVTPAQHQLSAKQRSHNLKAAFSVDIPLSGRHIAIVDDVVTTGSTVGEIAQMLKSQGAATVQIWCLCRTL